MQIAQTYLEKEASKEANVPIQHFVDDDAGYLHWVQSHPSGFVVKCARNPTAA
jgi:hypothetical protein